MEEVHGAAQERIAELEDAREGAEAKAAAAGEEGRRAVAEARAEAEAAAARAKLEAQSEAGAAHAEATIACARTRQECEEAIAAVRAAADSQARVQLCSAGTGHAVLAAHTQVKCVSHLWSSPLARASTSNMVFLVVCPARNAHTEHAYAPLFLSR